MLLFAFVINIMIVTPLTILLLTGSPAMVAVYWPQSDARKILACLYGTIGLLSAWGLLAILTGNLAAAISLAWTLLPFQIVYKICTWPAVGLQSPVVKTNLAVVIFHAIALFTIS